MCTDNKKIIIAIDGYSSSGKSSMARALARTIGYRYIDSGAMYRAVTLYAMRHDMIAPDGTVNADALTLALPCIHIDFDIDGDRQSTMLNNENVENEIRQLPVSNNVSSVAAIPAVRHRLVAIQQNFGHSRGIVMDGRDIGTTVFPDAELKIFVNAPAETRAARRLKELLEKGEIVTYDEILANVQHRDHIDETRAESPLRRANDAIDFDNSDMTIDEQNKALLKLYNDTIS
ncbi:MAG: (d)CMP kinase [Muribaculaceae bacterium]|nr:(d)CMP kinase [Muribaculaceae bacterium]